LSVRATDDESKNKRAKRVSMIATFNRTAYYAAERGMIVADKEKAADCYFL
jgi:hypothetical protein